MMSSGIFLLCPAPIIQGVGPLVARGCRPRGLKAHSYLFLLLLERSINTCKDLEIGLSRNRVVSDFLKGAGIS